MKIDEAELCDIFCVMADSKDEYSGWRYFKMKTKEVAKDDLIIALVGLSLGLAKMVGYMTQESVPKVFRRLADTHRRMRG